jgi:hypothetical protein
MGKNTISDARIKERRTVALRLEGLTYTQIAEKVGYKAGPPPTPR